MSMHLVSVIVPRPVATPRGAEWASRMAISLAQMGRRVSAALVSVQEARAQRALDRLAIRRCYDADTSTEMRDAMTLYRGNRG